MRSDYAVTIGSRKPESVNRRAWSDAKVGEVEFTSVEVAAQGDLVLLAVPWEHVDSTLRFLGPWDGRVLIDATNPFVGAPLRLVDLGGRSSSCIVAEKALGARVVKAFNSLTMDDFDKGPNAGDAKRVLFVSGDDDDAKQLVSGMIDRFGYAPIDIGTLEAGGKFQQAGGPLAGIDLLLIPKDLEPRSSSRERVG